MTPSTPDNPPPQRPAQPVLRRPARDAGGDRPVRPTRDAARPVATEPPPPAVPVAPIPVVPGPIDVPRRPAAVRRPVWRPTVLPSAVVLGMAALGSGVAAFFQPADAALRRLGPGVPFVLIAVGVASLAGAGLLSASLRPASARIDSPARRSYDPDADSTRK